MCKNVLNKSILSYISCRNREITFIRNIVPCSRSEWPTQKENLYLTCVMYSICILYEMTYHCHLHGLKILPSYIQVFVSKVDDQSFTQNVIAHPATGIVSTVLLSYLSSFHLFLPQPHSTMFNKCPPFQHEHIWKDVDMACRQQSPNVAEILWVASKTKVPWINSLAFSTC